MPTQTPFVGWRKDLFPVFFIVWMLLALCAFVIFQVNRNAALKRRLFPVFVIIAGAVFAAFMICMAPGDKTVIFIVVPIVIVVILANLKRANFCNACGKMVISQSLFSRPRFCPHCGAALK